MIETLESEINFLNQELQFCNETEDYKGADTYSQIRSRVRRKLRILKNLENPHFEQINLIEHKIIQLDKLKDRFPEANLQSLETLNLKISLLKKELENLNADKPTFIDGDELIITLEKLINSEIDKFIFELKENEISLNFNNISKGLEIRIFCKTPHGLKFYSGPSGVVKLKQMGFILSEGQWTKVFTSFTHKSILELLELLSRITFDVFHLFGRKEGKIIY